MTPEGYFTFEAVDDKHNPCGSVAIHMSDRPRLFTTTTDDGEVITRISVGRYESYYTLESRESLYRKMAHAQQK